MSQSTFIAAALIAGFVLFLAARNRLSTYAAVLWGSTGAPVPPPAAAPSAFNSGAGPLGGAQGAAGPTGGIIGPLLKGLASIFSGGAAL